jgi:RimJ/RimL family protein N-acetyltransferase
MNLETLRLRLRDFKKTDWKAVHEYARDTDVSRFMIWGPNTQEQTIVFVDSTLESQTRKPRLTFDLAVILRDTNQLIGSAGIRLIPEDPEQGAIGYVYHKKYWGQGFATEACRELIKFGFKDLKLHRIFATCDRENTGSANVLRKSGMRQEGHFVKDKKIKGLWRDTLLFAILKSEWKDDEG